MANEETKLTRCSFQMMFSFWSDLFNFIAGIGLFHLGGTHILIATGYLIFHLASLLYLMLFKKLGFKYHLKTTRLLILAPQLFLFIPAIIVRAENRYLDHQLIVLCKSGVVFGFIWSLACFLLVIITEYCDCSKTVPPNNDKPEERKVMIEMPMKATNTNVGSLNKDHKLRKVYPDTDVENSNQQAEVQYANAIANEQVQVQANAPPMNWYEHVNIKYSEL